MAQEVTLMGATYSDVPSILLPDSNSILHQFTDVSDSTLTSTSDLASGVTAYDNTGTLITGTASGGITPTGTLSITANGTYDVTNYASASVNVSGGGSSSSWTLVASTSYQVSTTSSSTETVTTWATGHSEIWTSEKYVFIRIRDTAGKRNGYFYGCDCFFINDRALTTGSTCTNMAGSCFYYNSSAFGHRYIYNTAGYGIYADYLYSDGRIRIRSRYHSTYSCTIDGTYSVEVYLLTPPTNAPIFT